MLAKREIWRYPKETGIWVGKYRNSHNLLHWHFECEFAYVEKGCIEIFCEKKRHILRAGEALFADSGQMHYQRALEPDTVLIVFVFDGACVPFLQEYRLAAPKLGGRYPVPALYKKLRETLLSRPPFYGEEARCALCGMMVEIFRREPYVRRIKMGSTEETFKKLLEAIREGFASYTFADAVHFMGMSEAYFSRYFKAATGTTFSQYLNHVRTDSAIRMLQTDKTLTVTEVADRCGFGTIRNFNRIFKELTGTAPSRLPQDYTLGERFPLPSDEAFDPTLYDCELLESSAAP